VLQLFDTPEDQELYGIEQIYEASFLASCSNYLELAQLFHTNIRVLHLDAAESRGPCLARSLAQTLWKDEKFYFQIDSHMRLRPCYDSYLLQTYSQCEEILSAQVKNLPGDTHLFPVLSTYPPGYQLNDALPLTDIRSTVLVWLFSSLSTRNFLNLSWNSLSISLQVPSGFDADGMLRQKARLLKRIPTAPLLTHLWAAGFSFTEANVTPFPPPLLLLLSCMIHTTGCYGTSSL
jgi:[Skp1-protein]-hydroxyproline N-acetylglucosaminyltransferase